MTPSPTQLLRRFHRGDPQAAEALWTLLAPRMLGVASRIVDREAEDLVQQAFLKALQTPRREIRKVRDAEAWLFVILRNSCLSIVRERRREALRRARVANGSPVSPSGSASKQPLAEPPIARLLEHLSDDLREPVLLRHAGGLTFSQIALVLQLPRSTVADRYTRALEAMRKLAADQRSAHQDRPPSLVEARR
ncbi:MAG: RNA polymerase sigma factor [Phycisphaerales bacterium]|nr:RNA polymerase sigma factor [Phycisphaerales bacterium]